MRGAILSAAVLALTVTSAPAFASGTGSPSGALRNGGGFENGALRAQENETLRLVRRGKAQARKKISCKSCEYHKNLNKRTAEEVALAVRNGKFDLDNDDRLAVLYYLRSRYGV